jgi:hypothetical protein
MGHSLRLFRVLRDPNLPWGGLNDPSVGALKAESTSAANRQAHAGKSQGVGVMAPTAAELPIFRTEEIRAKLVAICGEGLRHWPVPFETFFVNTRYGRTHVIASGDPAAPPLVMTRPAAVGGFVWSSIIAPLSEHRRVCALDTIGDFGRSGLVGPDTTIGYCSGPNRLGFGLIDQRELALRDTLDRDMVGERPQCPTQRQPPPEAPAGDRQPPTPRRSDPEHPPLGAPRNPCERFQHGERILRWLRSMLLRTTT